MLILQSSFQSVFILVITFHEMMIEVPFLTTSFGKKLTKWSCQKLTKWSCQEEKPSSFHVYRTNLYMSIYKTHVNSPWIPPIGTAAAVSSSESNGTSTVLSPTAIANSAFTAAAQQSYLQLLQQMTQLHQLQQLGKWCHYDVMWFAIVHLPLLLWLNESKTGLSTSNVTHVILDNRASSNTEKLGVAWGWGYDKKFFIFIATN